MPSTVSSLVSRPLPSSTVMTPSLPTFSIASAISLPISLSLFAEMVPTWAISFLPAVGTEMRLELLDDRLDGPVDAALQLHRVGAGGDVLEPFAEDRLGQHGGGGGAVAGDVGGLGGDLLDHLRAHVLDRIAQLDLLGDGDAVLGDGRRAELLVDDDVPALGAERDLDRLGELSTPRLSLARASVLKRSSFAAMSDLLMGSG